MRRSNDFLLLAETVYSSRANIFIDYKSAGFPVLATEQTVLHRGAVNVLSENRFKMLDVLISNQSGDFAYFYRCNDSSLLSLIIYLCVPQCFCRLYIYCLSRKSYTMNMKHKQQVVQMIRSANRNNRHHRLQGFFFAN